MRVTMPNSIIDSLVRIAPSRLEELAFDYRNNLPANRHVNRATCDIRFEVKERGPPDLVSLFNMRTFNCSLSK